MELVLGAQAVLAAATVVVAGYQGWNTADLTVFVGAGLIGMAALVVAVLTVVPLILLHHRPGPSRRTGLPFAMAGQGVAALVTLYAFTHSDVLPADAVVLGLAGPVVAVGFAALPAARRFVNAPAAGTEPHRPELPRSSHTCLGSP